ncbi:MAG: restriction endonuclease subunit S [Rikenellaceae bacterium]
MDYKNYITALGFAPKEGTASVYSKQYSLHGNYCIDINLDRKEILYNEIVSDSKTTANFSQPENFVVLECVDRLLQKGYKPQNIVLEKVWRSGHGTSGRLDVCVNHDDGTPYLLIECKTYGKEFDKELAKTHKDGGQLFTYFQLSGCKADVIMLYASELSSGGIVYKNEIIKIEDDYRSGEVKDIFEKWNKLTKDNGVFDEWVVPYNFQSKALTKAQLKVIRHEDSSFIFNRFLEILRHNVVSDKGNAFNKIFTLFLCKVYDETSSNADDELAFQWKEGVDNHVDFQLRLTDLYAKGMDKFLDRKVSDFSEEDFHKRCDSSIDPILKEYILKQMKMLRLEKNNEFAIKEVYDAESFEENAKVVKEVVELLQGYRIRYNKRQQYLSDFFELLLTTGLKQEAGQFFTPVPVSQFIIKSLPVNTIVTDKLKHKDGDILPYMIDYAAGSGHFITEYMHEIQKIITKITPDKYIEETHNLISHWQLNHFAWAPKYVYGIEKDYRLVKVGKVGCYLHGDGLANVILGDGLANFSNTKSYKGRLSKGKVDGTKDNQQFDILLSNPPYSVSSFKQTTGDLYSANDFDLYSYLTDNSSEIECLFIERTKQLLKDGGVTGVILPSSILSNTGIYTKTREIILKYFEIIAVTELGSNTFMATGTNTVVLFLRRRNNFENENILTAVKKFFKDNQDVTINTVEAPVAKYLSHVWGEISFADYLTLLNKEPNETVQKSDIYKDYRKKIKASNEAKFWEEVLSLECDKLFYFVIAYPQTVVLVKSGSKDEEKRFLGYEFSNRKGSEGIHPIQRGKHIEECTQLFDAEVYNNPDKASTYIYQAFNGDVSSEIAESMQKNVSRARLVDMMTFDRTDFEKGLFTSVKKKVNFDEIWGTSNLVSLGDVANIRKGTSITKEKTAKGDIPVIAGGQEAAYYHNVSNRDGNVITISASGAYSGFANYHVNPIFASDCNTIESKDESKISTFVIFQLLKSIQSELYTLQRGQAQPHVYGEDIAKIRIPVLSMEVQQSIVDEINLVDANVLKMITDTNVLRSDIENIISNNSNAKTIKLESIATLLKRGKSAKYGDSKTQIIKSGQARGFRAFDFKQKFYVADSFILDERKLQKGDILINSTGVGTAGRVTMFDFDGDFVADSHITILRIDPTIADPTYVLYALGIGIGFKKIEKMAQGQSGQIELSLTIIQNIQIPLPSLTTQKEIVSKIEKLEAEITKAQNVIDTAPEQKQAILKKYL